MSTIETRRSGATSLCTFWLDGRCFGIDVLDVQEVIRAQDVTAVPLAPHVVVGLINLRGQIIPTCDLRRRLGLDERLAEQAPMNVVVQAVEGPLSLLVDEIGDVIDVEPDQFEAPPSTLEGEVRELILGAHKLDGRLLLELDTHRLIAEMVPA